MHTPEHFGDAICVNTNIHLKIMLNRKSTVQWKKKIYSHKMSQAIYMLYRLQAYISALAQFIPMLCHVKRSVILSAAKEWSAVSMKGCIYFLHFKQFYITMEHGYSVFLAAQHCLHNYSQNLTEVLTFTAVLTFHVNNGRWVYCHSSFSFTYLFRIKSPEGLTA